jgi:hypothetical protein
VFDFIWRGRVSSIADMYGFHTTPRRDLEFTGLRIGRWKMLGVLHARERTGEAQPRFPDDRPYFKDEIPAQVEHDDVIWHAAPDEALVPTRFSEMKNRPAAFNRAQDPPRPEPSAGLRRAQDPPSPQDQ